jgi:hypothetical protein
MFTLFVERLSGKDTDTGARLHAKNQPHSITEPGIHIQIAMILKKRHTEH